MCKCDLTNPEWLSLQPPEYQRSVWLGRAATRHEFAQKATNPEEARGHHLAAAEFEKLARAAMKLPITVTLPDVITGAFR